MHSWRRGGGELNKRKKGEGFLCPNLHLSPLIFMLQCMTLQRAVSAHGPAAAAAGLVICRLESKSCKE